MAPTITTTNVMRMRTLAERADIGPHCGKDRGSDGDFATNFSRPSWYGGTMMPNTRTLQNSLWRAAMVLLTATGLTLAQAAPASAQVQARLSGVNFLPKAGTSQDTLTVQDWVKRP